MPDFVDFFVSEGPDRGRVYTVPLFHYRVIGACAVKADALLDHNVYGDRLLSSSQEERLQSVFVEHQEAYTLERDADILLKDEALLYCQGALIVLPKGVFYLDLDMLSPFSFKPANSFMVKNNVFEMQKIDAVV